MTNPPADDAGAAGGEGAPQQNVEDLLSSMLGGWVGRKCLSIWHEKAFIRSLTLAFLIRTEVNKDKMQQLKLLDLQHKQQGQEDRVGWSTCEEVDQAWCADAKDLCVYVYLSTL